MPGFLGGSDLAVPAQSGNKALAPTGSRTSRARTNEQALQAKGNIPNATNLLGTSVNERAAARSWFVPPAKHWVDVENGNILRNMLAQILTGKLTVKQAAASASDNIASVLNGSLGPQLSGAAPTRNDRRRRDHLQVVSAAAPHPAPASRAARCRTLILPVVAVLGAILGYPIYRLVRLSLQKYTLFELIRHKGVLGRAATTSRSVLHDQVFWHTLLRTVVFTVANVGADDRRRDADRAAARARQRLGAACSSPPGSCSSGRCRRWSRSRSGTG